MSEFHREGHSNPMILYHYTSAAGLHGIVASESLWTSHYRFLNDTSEFRHGWDIVLAAIERRAAEIRQIPCSHSALCGQVYTWMQLDSAPP
ncbi:hypothetical protein [Bradyrhizobium sp. 23AC]